MSKSLVHFTNFTTAPDTAQVAAGATLYDGLVDEIGTDFEISSGNLRQTLALKHRLNHVVRPSSEAVSDQTIIVEFLSLAGNYNQLWAKFNIVYAGGYRAWFGPGGGSVSCDRCIAGIADQGPGENAFTGGTPASGTSMIMEFRCSSESGSTRLTVTVWLKTDWQSIPQGAAQATNTVLCTDATLDVGVHPAALSQSQYSGTNITAQNMWTYNSGATVGSALVVPRSTVSIGYLGSSTWYNDAGTGTIPAKIGVLLAAAFPSASITTYNDAVGGSQTSTWLPNSTNLNVLKAHMQAASGYRIVRCMIGSNDASNSVTVAAWKVNMQLIINEILSWGVEKVLLEEIGVRLDGSTTAAQITLLMGYNAARSQLTGCEVGNATTFDYQSTHLNLLGGDLIHQTDAGNTATAAIQYPEMSGFTNLGGGQLLLMGA